MVVAVLSRKTIPYSYATFSNVGEGSLSVEIMGLNYLEDRLCCTAR